MNNHNVDQVNSAQEAAVPSPYVDKITALLAEAGHANPDAWKQHLEADAYITNDDSIQRFLINRALRLCLAQAPVSTMDERYCLVDQGDMDRWVQLVKEKVAPCMVTHNLPPTK